MEEQEIQTSHVWQMVKNLEESTQSDNAELSEIRATLLVNFGDAKRADHFIRKFSGHERTFAIMLEVLEHFIKKP